MGKKLIKSQLKANPEFSEWLKANPDLIRKVKEDPSALEGMIVNWKKAEAKKSSLHKAHLSYRYMVNQIQELNTLLQRVDEIMSNVRTISERINTSKTDVILEEAAVTSPVKGKKKRK